MAADDLAALRAIYVATGGPSTWIRNGCWDNDTVPVCWWDQVLCNTTTWRVIELRFASNNMVGALPEELGMLGALRVCWTSAELKTLSLYPRSFIRLFSHNDFQHATLPSAHLEVLQLTFNRGLSGVLPQSLGNLSNLKRLYAWNTSLIGIPETIGGLHNLIAIDLTDNLIQGPVPLAIARLTNVDTVYFDGNEGITCPLDAPVQKWLDAVKYHADPCASS